MSFVLGHGVRNAGVADLALGAHQALGHRRRRHQKRARDLVGLQAAQRAQRQRDLRLERKRRMAAGEDQAQAIVGDLVGVVVGSSIVWLEPEAAYDFEFFLRRVCAGGCGRWLCAGRSG